MNNYRIALLPGDGIGTEVMEAAWPVLQTLAKQHNFGLEGAWLPWSCDHYQRHGCMMPADGVEQLKAFDAIYLGAVGLPAQVPDHISLRDLLLAIRQGLDLSVNARPHRLLAGVPGPLRSTEPFDILCIRENTEGEYSGAGGRVHQGGDLEVAVETSIFTRAGVERVLRHGFEQARKRSGRLASVTKSNAQRHSMVFWDEMTDRVAADYPNVKVTRYHVDAIAARMITAPQTLDVIVASNLFGDILTDIGAAIQGGLGFAASANINPAGGVPGMFEPVHGSAPDIMGKGLANPLATLWAGALMLEHLRENAAAADLMTAIETVTATGAGTPDMGGSLSTGELAEKVRTVLGN
ncbi:tartrate dehydrogenase [Marinobacterium sp. D7]|uniref:tartrate dehydrogenase n=1 Tax=Marinobacterium ramblicola TaxID=2849041 RepID=UPI001C2D0F69|nr:tartrate dehydrogenase [Marinobacterium ramblicola]MBV1790785.1 tartrate dehydrogenase [Marinobacterium ramblicola]